MMRKMVLSMMIDHHDGLGVDDSITSSILGGWGWGVVALVLLLPAAK